MIRIECVCDYKGKAEMVVYPEIPNVRFPTCPVCGETVFDIMDEEEPL